MPGEAGRDLIDPETLRDMMRAASRHPRTRWCVTLVDSASRTAVAHGCAPGQHSWDPPPPGLAGGAAGTAVPDGAGGLAAGDGAAGSGCTGNRGTGGAADCDLGRTGGEAGPTPAQLAHLAGFLERLKAGFRPITRGGAEYGYREEGYRPSRRLAHLIRARNATCTAPGCGASASYADIDHTVAWPAGETGERNLGPLCRQHHRLKQSPGWQLEQLEPGAFRWTTPAGRAYETQPTRYDFQ
jgi:hypothetical protein